MPFEMTGDTPERMLGGMKRDLEKVVSKDRKRVFDAFERAKKRTNKDFADYRATRIQEIFAEAVDKFYGDYKPITPGFRRSKSLYDILEIRDEVVDDVSIKSLWLEPDNMSAFRSGYRMSRADSTTDQEESPGDDLYARVFEQGWHGGARRSGKKGSFESDYRSDIMYWRKPLDIWWWWGRRAARADISPYQSFLNMIKEVDHPGGEFQTKHVEYLSKYFDEEMNSG